MYLKNKGNIMIFTIIFSAIITLILLFFCTMSVNIIKNSRVNIYTKDLYSIDDYEEEIIKLCSNKINECGLEEIKNSDEVYCISDNDFKCSYIKEKDYFNIIYNENNKSRILNYKVNENKVALIPTYKYKKGSER